MSVNPTTIAPFGRRWFRIGRRLLLLPVFVVFAFYLCSSALVAIEGGFIPKQVYCVSSPDGRATITGTKRVMFPVNELVDPSIVVVMELRDAAANRVLDSARLELVEDSDLREPRIEWSQSTARITQIDGRCERTFAVRQDA